MEADANNKMVTHDEVKQSSSEARIDNDGDDSDSHEPQSSVAAFSVAQALSMVKRRREEQERARQEEEKLLGEQRRERAKEKRQRRRKNQKERRAKLREDTNADVSPNTIVTCDSSKPGSCVTNEIIDNQAGGTKRPIDHETVDGNTSGRPGGDDEIDIKKLPVKKRLRLDGALKQAATTEGVNRTEAPATETTTTKATPTQSALGSMPTAEMNHSNRDRFTNNAVKKVTTLVPRALLLKKPKR